MHQSTQMALDTQQVEIIGRNLLLSCCIADGVEVAQPMRDRGIDIIIFNDITEREFFLSLPVQLKASSSRSFSINSKYARIPNLLMAYVWFSNDPVNAELYIMRYSDALSIGERLGWLNTRSWVEGGAYSTQSPSKQVTKELEPFAYSIGKINNLLLSFKQA
ncbi:hypothetical protein EON76_04175 [bacterium]|nr:MAG: hypothetical protein EON76_04175 [bacterium]